MAQILYLNLIAACGGWNLNADSCSDGIHVIPMISRDLCMKTDSLSLQIPLATMLAYLESSMRSANQQRRSASIVKSLRRSENFQVQEDNVKCKDRYAESQPRDFESEFV